MRKSKSAAVSRPTKLSCSRGITLPMLELSEIRSTSGGIVIPGLVSSVPLVSNGRLMNNGRSQQRDNSESPTTSPVGYTIRHSSEHSHAADLTRSLLSDSFYESTIENALDIRIFYPDGRAMQFRVQDGASMEASGLLDLVADHLNIDFPIAEEALALWLISPLLEIQMKPYHIPFVVYEKWPAFLRKFTTSTEDQIALDEPLIVLRRNVLFTMQREIENLDLYERLTEVLYLNAKDEYLTGRYLVDMETALELVGLQLAITYGPYESNEEALELIHDNCGELVPAQHRAAVRSFHLFGLHMMECRHGLENRIVDDYKTASERFQNAHQLRKAYLEILRGTPFYGAAFFSGTFDRKLSSTKEKHSYSSIIGAIRRYLSGANSKIDVLIGINEQFITLIDPTRHKLLYKEKIDNYYPASSPMSMDQKISLICHAVPS